MNTQRIFQKASNPVYPHSLAAFRIVFGVILLWEVYRYFRSGWIDRYWVEPGFNFTYGFFHWVEPLPQPGMDILFYLLAILSLFLILGLFYRSAATLIFLIFTYTFLLEQARYLNHFYLVVLLSFLMIFVPANAAISLDSRIFPKIRQKRIPYRAVFIMQFQIGIVYFFGGIAKLNDDWLSGSPMDRWLPARDEFPVLGEYFSEPLTALVISYSGLLLDLLAFPLLMYRKTRPWIMLALCFFHFMNDRLFTIGIFPWFMIGALSLYLPTDWPHQLFDYLKTKTLNGLLFLLTLLLSGAFIASWFHEGISVVPFVSGFAITMILIWDFHKNPFENTPPGFKVQRTGSSTVVTSLLGIWCIFQVLIPLRHLVIPGNPSWTEEGHRFAWHMKLRSKNCDIKFYIGEEQNPSVKREITYEPWLQDWQRSKMESRPNLLIQFASFLSNMNGGAPVYADALCSLNGSERRRLIDPDVDLSQVRFYDWKANDWIFR